MMMDRFTADRVRSQLRVLPGGYGDIASESSRKAHFIDFERRTQVDLANDGFLGYPLQSISLDRMHRNGVPMWFEAGAKRGFYWKDTPHMRVAIHPDQDLLFMPGSESHTHQHQVDLVSWYDREIIQKQFPGARAVLGKGPDIVQLAVLHHQATGTRLLDTAHSGVVTTTSSQAGEEFIYVGYRKGVGFGFGARTENFVDPSLQAMVLIVPDTPEAAQYYGFLE